MKQYVTLSDDRQKIPLMMQLVASFDYVVVQSEHEALVLERNLIEQYHPYFNVDFKDDKSYPYIAVTHGDAFPAIKYTRESHRAGTRYFGPYTDARAAREMIDTLRKGVPICNASCAGWKHVRRLLEKHPADSDVIELVCAEKGRPCFDYHVGRGPGVCAGMIGREEYAKNVRRVERFLSGKRRELIDELKGDMAESAAELDFERAGRIKRRLEVSTAKRLSRAPAFLWCARAVRFVRANSFWIRALTWTRRSSSRDSSSATTTRPRIFPQRSMLPAMWKTPRLLASG